MVYTGGILNWLNGKMGISAPQNSVPIIALIKAHKPKTYDELYQLISKHAGEKCDCGIRSQGSIEDFVRNLYDAQMKVWGEYRFSLQECIEWEYDLFVIQSLKGYSLESKVKLLLQEKLNENIIVEGSNKYIDSELRIDLEVKRERNIICGIQVKPSSFENMRKGVVRFNKSANEKYGYPVYYIHYEYETEEILDLDETIKKIKELL